jgi:hypothetical protein
LRKNLVFRLAKTINHYFPDLYEKISDSLTDCRDKTKYELNELIMASIAMYLFKEGSRNAFNNEREEEKFKNNYEKLFKVRLPHMDTVDKVMRQLDEEELESLKTELIRGLIAKKVFYKYRFLGKHYLIVIDGTHIMNVSEGHCEHCLKRTSKNGKVTYFHNVLEAKLVCSNGFCISLSTEWIENPSGDFDKQDCELKAFKRLSEKLKNNFPCLPICIVGDGLYPNKTFFDICQTNQWDWIVTFKDGNLPTVWQEVLGLQKLLEQNARVYISQKGNKKIRLNYKWVNDIDYNGHILNWFECVEEIDNDIKRFVYISNIKIDYDNVLEMTESGRLRWKIENEGFNIQKNNGYGLTHKYSRKSMTATKNYYLCMQIAHMINQLFELGSLFKPLLEGKVTIVHLWKVMLGQLRHALLEIHLYDELLKRKINIRYS